MPIGSRSSVFLYLHPGIARCISDCPEKPALMKDKLLLMMGRLGDGYGESDGLVMCTLLFDELQLILIYPNGTLNQLSASTNHFPKHPD